MASRSRGRGRLPVCVVRIRSVLRFMGFSGREIRDQLARSARASATPREHGLVKALGAEFCPNPAFGCGAHARRATPGREGTGEFMSRFGAALIVASLALAGCAGDAVTGRGRQ